MDIEYLRIYCLSLPQCTEDMAFGEDLLLLRICGKIFACISLNGNGFVTLKCDPNYAIELRELYPADIQPAWHWNKKYWNQVKIDGHLKEEFIKELINHSYKEVVKKLPKATRDSLLTSNYNKY